MLKAIAPKGIIIGLAAGFFTSILYLAAVILIHTLSDLKHFFDLELIITIMLSCLATIPAALIGAITGTVFALLFPIFRYEKTPYVITCFSLCTLVFIGFLTVLNPNWLHNIDTLSHDRSEYIFTVNLCILPGMLYSLLGLVISGYMFNYFKLIELDHETSTDNYAANP